MAWSEWRGFRGLMTFALLAAPVRAATAPVDFSQPAVRWAEERDRQRLYPRVFLWGSSMLEHVLASRGPLAEAFGLR